MTGQRISGIERAVSIREFSKRVGIGTLGIVILAAISSIESFAEPVRRRSLELVIVTADGGHAVSGPKMNVDLPWVKRSDVGDQRTEFGASVRLQENVI